MGGNDRPHVVGSNFKRVLIKCCTESLQLKILCGFDFRPYPPIITYTLHEDKMEIPHKRLIAQTIFSPRGSTVLEGPWPPHI
jgi:hypothetical protein